MWTCPNCGRVFGSENQQHDCGKAPETIDAYIDAQDEVIRHVLHLFHVERRIIGQRGADARQQHRDQQSSPYLLHL